MDESRELDRQIAGKFGGISYFFEEEGQVYGSVYDPADYEMQHLIVHSGNRDLYVVPHYSTNLQSIGRVEKSIEYYGCASEYERALESQGVGLEIATAEQRCRAALEIFPVWAKVKACLSNALENSRERGKRVTEPDVLATDLTPPRPRSVDGSPVETEDNSPTLKPPLSAFIDVARRFCTWVENPPAEAGDDILTAWQLLTELYRAGVLLADKPWRDDVRALSFYYRGGSVSTRGMAERISQWPIKSCWDVRHLFKPEIEEPFLFDLADDLAIIYVDIKAGFEYSVPRNASAMEGHWVFGFWQLWGYCVLRVLRALHDYLEPQSICE